MSHLVKTIAALFTLSLLCAEAQWLNYPVQRTPRTRNGKPNLGAVAPRASNGKPDLSGVWEIDFAPAGENVRLFGSAVKDFSVPGDDPSTFPKYFFNILADFKAEQSPLRPEIAERFNQSQAARASTPPLLCLPLGLPRADLFNYAPFKIIQTPEELAVLYEADNSYRQIYTDGRKLPADPQPAWMGYSVGKWEGNTLVVDATGFTELNPLDLMGHPHSGDLRIQERFHRGDFGHLDLSLTIDDPKTFSSAFTIKVGAHLLADSDILESVCNENERDRAHLGGTTH